MTKHTNSQQDKIIGGKFGLPVNFANNHETPPFLQGKPKLLFNARSGIKIVVDVIKPRTVWLPSYLCPTMVSAIDDNIAKVEYYPIDGNLQFSSGELLETIMPGDLFVFIDYFGFPFNRDLLIKLRARSVITLQDCCQALFFDPRESQADFCLYSPRKFLGVPDGGILHITSDIAFDIPVLNQPPDEVLYTLMLAVIKRREFDLFGGNREWNDYFHRGESGLFPTYDRMSDFSLLLLNHALNYPKIISNRRHNYAVLLEKLGQIAVYDHLLDSVVPIGFPIIIKDRDRLRKHLFQKNVYPPIHWEFEASVPRMYTASHKLSKHILTLPCDQRYDKDDMLYIADSVISLI